MLLSGVATAAMPLVADASFAMLAAATCGFAFFGGAFPAMFGLLLADLFGLNRTVAAMGMSQLVFALGTFLGSPISGWIYDTSGSYVPAFALAGGSLVVGALVMPQTERFQDHPEHRRQLGELG